MSALAWICPVCGTMVPRHAESTAAKIGLCTICYGELQPVDIDEDAALIAELRNQATPIRVEVEFYGREEAGVRYHVSTREIALPARSGAGRLAFLLSDQLRSEGVRGGHHGIRRSRVILRGQ